MLIFLPEAALYRCSIQKLFQKCLKMHGKTPVLEPLSKRIRGVWDLPGRSVRSPVRKIFEVSDGSALDFNKLIKYWIKTTFILSKSGKLREVCVNTPYSTKYRKKWTRKNSAFGHFSRSGNRRKKTPFLDTNRKAFYNYSASENLKIDNQTWSDQTG